MKILVKFPSRSRPIQFSDVLKKCQDMSYDPSQIIYHVTLDLGDTDLPIYKRVCDSYENVYYKIGYSTGKIHACNRDIDDFDGWDVLVLMSDDMVPVKTGWDKIIRDKMKSHHPELDGVLWFHDGHTDLNTMCIMGRNYFKAFGYIYHPDYISLWCDNEFQAVAELLGKTNKIPFECIFEHEHFSTDSRIKADKLMAKNQKYYLKDKETFLERKSNNFGL